MPLTTEQAKVLEETSAIFTATLLSDETDATSTVAASSLTALTLTLYDVCSGDIINTRDDQDILNDNNVTVDEDGLLTWSIQSEDNQIVSTTLAAGEDETHIALITWIWATGQGREEITLLVRQLDKVT
jgi:hypothetical protein